MATKRRGTMDDAGYVKLGPPAKGQPKRKPNCCVCGSTPPGPNDLAGTTRKLREAGWRYRDTDSFTFIVCPTHVQEGDW